MPTAKPRQRQQQPLAQHQPENVSSLSSHRHANGNLMGALARRIGDHSVDTYSRENQSE